MRPTNRTRPVPGSDRLPDLERGLTRMVQMALRKGIGAPTLVTWVQRTAANLGFSDPDECVPQLTKMLVVQLNQAHAKV